MALFVGPLFGVDRKNNVCTLADVANNVTAHGLGTPDELKIVRASPFRGIDGNTYLFSKGWRFLEEIMQVVRDKLVQLRNCRIVLRLVIAVTFSMPGTEFMEVFRVRFGEMGVIGPYLVKNAKRATEFVELCLAGLDRIRRDGGGGRTGACACAHTRRQLSDLVSILSILGLQVLWEKS